MYLVKHCKPQHNIFVTNELLIGTLFNFRKIEDPGLVDDEEGKFRIKMTFPKGSKIEIDIANILFGNLIGFGKFPKPVQNLGEIKIHINNLSIQKTDAKYVYVDEIDLQIERNYQNSFVFCMSIQENLQIKKFHDYDDFWSIPLYNLNLFTRDISNLIIDNMKYKYISGIMDSNYRESQNLRIICEHRQIEYKVYSEGNHLTVPRFVQALRRLSIWSVLALLSPPVLGVLAGRR